MRQLWMEIPPFLSDTFGFQEVMDVTDGFGIMDDCTDYRAQSSRLSSSGTGYRKRMYATGIRMEDVTGGTEKKIKETAREILERNKPEFIMVTTGPVSAMIGTDIEAAASDIALQSGIPAASVEMTGHKYYDAGMAKTLKAMAELLTEPKETEPGTCNLLGGNDIDFGENVDIICHWAETHGIKVVSQWGGVEQTKNLRQAASAAINLVTAAAGLPLANYLNKIYGTPYISAVPFGKSWSEAVYEAVKTGIQPEPPVCGTPEVLILGEQLTANAIRETLIRDFNWNNIQTASFFQMDKTISASSDKRLKGETDLKELFNQTDYKLIIGAPEFRKLWHGTGTFISLPHGAVSFQRGNSFPVLVGDGLNRWLEAQGIRKGGIE